MRALSSRFSVQAAVLVSAAIGVAACGASSTGDQSSVVAPVGANHTVHLRSGVFGPGMNCAGCHAPHGFGVDFSQNPAVQAAGAAYDPVTKTCSNVACHGTFTLGAVSGSHAAVKWNDTAPITCSSCHGMPPSGHPGMGGNADAASCASCHSDTVNADGTISMAFGAHMDGLAQVTGGACSSCHGDPARQTSMPGVDVLVSAAPPIPPAGAQPWAEGAHIIHLNPNPAIAAARPTACAECHVIYSDAVHALSPPAQTVVYGPLATANGAVPTYNPATGGCSASYCHGNFDFAGVRGASTTMLWGDTTRVGCQSCHGMPPLGHPPVTSGTPASCHACHPTSVDANGLVLQSGGHVNARADIAALGCTSCHGDATRVAALPGTDVNLVSSPPSVTTGTSPSLVGAHLGHLNPAAATAISAPVACAECHVIPADFDHATRPPAQRVVFGALARTGGAAPTYVAGSLGCAATYCHGNFDFNGISGSRATVTWTDAAPLACTSCHGMPPTGHMAVPAPATAASCAPCHPSAVNANGTINLAGKGHLNGLADTSALGCAACHGDPARTGNLPGVDVNLASSPPVASAGAPAHATGAHMGHVNPTAAGFLMPPIACAECHVVPKDSAHARTPPPQKVAFGAVSRTGGALPTWSAATAGCSATYCHGNFSFNGVSGARAAPVWTSTAPLGCTSCHGMPPTGHFAVAAPANAASCARCHPDAVNADGSINRTAGGHINGRPDVNDLACTSCHGDATRKPNLAGTDANLTSAPPVAQPGAPAYAVGAHMGHMNPTAASYLMPPIACAECHTVHTDTAHATTPPAQKVIFGTLSRTGGAVPTFNATTSGCSATWCHGNFTLGAVSGTKTAVPLWTGAALTCTSCHGMIPTGHPTYVGTYDAASCFQCHPQSVNSDGTIKVGGGHINGKSDGGGCTACHGDPPTTGSHGDHRKERCDGCHPTGYTSTTAVSAFHNNGIVDIGKQAGYSCGTTGCTPKGTFGTCTVNCHGENHRASRW